MQLIVKVIVLIPEIQRLFYVTWLAILVIYATFEPGFVLSSNRLETIVTAPQIEMLFNCCHLTIFFV